jgi:hypothetical protein
MLGDLEKHESEDHSGASCLLRATEAQGPCLALEEVVGTPDLEKLSREVGLEHGGGFADLLPLLPDAIVKRGTIISESDAIPLFRISGTVVAAYRVVAASADTYGIGLGNGEGGIIFVDLPDPDSLGWLYLASRGFSATFSWHPEIWMPEQLRSILALTSYPLSDDLLEWRIDEIALAGLSNWAALNVNTDLRPDGRQEEVISSPAAARILVQAGPGSGKTWTACSRVASLIEQGVPPSRILVISFTRAAVEEIRQRIVHTSGDPSATAEVKIVTLDSLAGNLRSGFSGFQELGDYDFEKTISETCALLQEKNSELSEYLGRLAHVLVDEAQDLTGNRRDLVLGIIDALDDSAGATVFHDPVQAIYGFQAKGEAGVDILQKEPRSFRAVIMTTDYRSESDNLRTLFKTARQILSNTDGNPRTVYEDIRAAIETSATSSIGSPHDQTFSRSVGSTMVLFRSRRELIDAAGDFLNAGKPFRLRLQRNARVIKPWVSASISGFTGSTISRQDFGSSALALDPVPLIPVDEMWSILRRLAPSGNTSLDLDKLALLICSKFTPPSITETDTGMEGSPVLSTIHAAKGREAQVVQLMLPRISDDDNGTDWAEEARILFVGATRAKSVLNIGSKPSWLTSGGTASGRYWEKRSRKDHKIAGVEVGLDMDVDLELQSDPEYWGGFEAMQEVQQTLWQNCLRTIKLKAIRNGKEYRLLVDGGRDDGSPVGVLGRSFANDLWSIAGSIGGETNRPPNQIRGIYMISVTSFATSNTGDGQRFWLAPVISGIPSVFFSSGR